MPRDCNEFDQLQVDDECELAHRDLRSYNIKMSIKFRRTYRRMVYGRTANADKRPLSRLHMDSRPFPANETQKSHFMQ